MKWERPTGRRAFLGGTAATLAASGMAVSAIASPFVAARRADAQAFPKRFVVWFTPNGTIRDQWGATGTETTFTLKRILEPLERFKQKLVVLDGIDMESARHGPGDGHQQGMGHWLTGTELLAGDVMGGCDTCAPAGFSGGISIDQRIANHVARADQLRSLELGVKVGRSANMWTRMCYRGADQPLPPVDDPYEVFERLFGSFDPDASGLERRRAMRRSVLDFVRRDFDAISRRLGAEDRQRLAAHQQGVRELEQRLLSTTELGAACTAPTIDGRLDRNDDRNYPAIGRLQIDNLAMALACDLTRVASIQWSTSVGGVTSPWLGIDEGHHSLSHEDAGASAKEKLVQINRWYSEMLAYLLEKLDSIPEGSGTLLDNTIVLAGNELGEGGSHTRNNMPFLLAGSGGGAIRTGRYLRLDDRWHNDLYASLSRAFGIETDTFGNPRWCHGPIAEIA